MKLEDVNEASVAKRLDAVLVRFQHISNICARLMMLLLVFSYNERIFTERQNFVIYGVSGSGKTYVADILTEIFAQVGIVLAGKVVHEPRYNNMEEYTRQLYQAREIIIVDEAYSKKDELIDAVCNMIDIQRTAL